MLKAGIRNTRPAIQYFDPHFYTSHNGPLKAISPPLIPVITQQGLQQFRQIKVGRGFKPRIIPKKFQRRIDHRLHFIHVTKQPLLLLRIFDEFAAQTHPRQRCAQIVGNGGEHLRAVADEVLQLSLHGVEREDRLADFLGAQWFDGRGAEVRTEASGTFGEALPPTGAKSLHRTPPRHTLHRRVFIASFMPGQMERKTLHLNRRFHGVQRPDTSTCGKLNEQTLEPLRAMAHRCQWAGSEPFMVYRADKLSGAELDVIASQYRVSIERFQRMDVSKAG